MHMHLRVPHSGYVNRSRTPKASPKPSDINIVTHYTLKTRAAAKPA